MKINRSFDKLRIRRMQAKPKDFELLYKWLNDSRIQNYLDGKSSHYTLEQIRDTYEPIALDMKRVKPNIIEYQNHPIGYMQYYLLLPEEYIEYQEYNHQNHDHHEHLNLKHNITEKPKNEVAYGIDLFIGDINYWNQGLGTQSLKSLCQYLFDVLQADYIYIKPQLWNERAIKSYEKCGFKKIKVFKESQILKLKSPNLKENIKHE